MRPGRHDLGTMPGLGFFLSCGRKSPLNRSSLETQRHPFMHELPAGRYWTGRPISQEQPQDVSVHEARLSSSRLASPRLASPRSICCRYRGRIGGSCRISVPRPWAWDRRLISTGTERTDVHEAIARSRGTPDYQWSKAGRRWWHNSFLQRVARRIGRNRRTGNSSERATKRDLIERARRGLVAFKAVSRVATVCGRRLRHGGGTSRKSSTLLASLAIAR
jgi:hypothetical protein